jgi:glycosyltransferase involved in cell wall biosynthesis|tara:strand:+ start:660 stop:899 length:240 start_codon:yes stop_codon:yes gene_type:complete
MVEQDFPKNEYEIIVADNGSTDNTLDIANKYINNYSILVKYVIESNVQSSYAARNKGINIAKGDILAFTDSDCIPEKIG